MPQSKKQEHLTPDRVWNMLEELTPYSKQDFYDPCPVGTPYLSPCFFNGLYGDWKDINYVNPPFAVKILRQFYNKAKQQALKGRITIMLLPSKTDQDWFHDIFDNRYSIRWIKGRLKFKGNKDTAMGGHFLVMIK